MRFAKGEVPSRRCRCAFTPRVPVHGCRPPPLRGRCLQALDLFQALLVEKGDVLAQPDMLISAIGTRIYARWGPAEARLGAAWYCGARCRALRRRFGSDRMPRRPAPPPARNRHGAWEEDEGYTASLGAGWQLEGVREACYRALANVGKDAMHFRQGWGGETLALGAASVRSATR